ncbi:hypothetical protein BAPKO_0626 [Borreliella afzelii PKo]|nr:hypothetical protein BAPKO_0626 [Borreliella afzelii PKo]
MFFKKNIKSVKEGKND